MMGTECFYRNLSMRSSNRLDGIRSSMILKFEGYFVIL